MCAAIGSDFWWGDAPKHAVNSGSAGAGLEVVGWKKQEGAVAESAGPTPEDGRLMRLLTSTWCS
jgi:hypothetical protein